MSVSELVMVWSAKRTDERHVDTITVHFIGILDVTVAAAAGGVEDSEASAANCIRHAQIIPDKSNGCLQRES